MCLNTVKGIADDLVKHSPYLAQHIDECKEPTGNTRGVLSFHFKIMTMESTLQELVEEIKEYGYFNEVNMWWHRDLNGNGRVWAFKYATNHD